MSLKTHPNFNSVVPKVQDAKTMNVLVSEPLMYQYEYKKKTTPWEAKQWDPEALRRFEIKLENIDRLYCIGLYCIGISFAIIARLEYEEDSLYIIMMGNYDCFRSGYIFITKDVNVFIKVVIPDLFFIVSDGEYISNKNLIYNSLREDGIYVEEEKEIESIHSMGEPYTLKYLCHELIYENRYALRDYKIQLPKILARSVSDFIKTRLADIEYHYDYIQPEEKNYEDLESILM